MGLRSWCCQRSEPWEHDRSLTVTDWVAARLTFSSENAINTFCRLRPPPRWESDRFSGAFLSWGWDPFDPLPLFARQRLTSVAKDRRFSTNSRWRPGNYAIRRYANFATDYILRVCALRNATVILDPRKEPPRFLAEGRMSMTKSGLVCV